MATDYNLGTAEGRIQLTYDPSGIALAQKGLNQFQKSAQSAEANFSRAARNSGIAAAALGAGLVYVANTAIDFEKQISAIGAVSGATEQDLELLRKKALQLGADTSFSASQAANAMEELAKAGVSLPDILNGAADAAVALAAAGGVDLPEAAAIASNAMNVFSLKAKDLGEVVNYIAGAANASAIDVHEFGYSLSQAGAVAALQGVNFEDLATAIALMGNAGIKGSDAGTSLKTMLSNLTPVTKKQIELAKELGIITEDGSNKFYDQAGNLKNLADVAEILNVATKGLTAQQKALALETLFGSDAIRAAAILTKAGAKGFNELNAAINGVTADEVARKRLDNVAGSLERLKGSVETAAIQLGTALLPIIRKTADFLGELINRFGALDPKWQQFIAFGLLAATALATVVAAIAGIGAVIAGLAAASGVAEVIAIIVAAVAAVALLVVGFKNLYNSSEPLRRAVASIGEVFTAWKRSITAALTPVIAFIKNEVIPGILAIKKDALDRLTPAFNAIGEFIRTRVVPAFKQISDAVKEATPTLIKIGRVLLGGMALGFRVLGTVLGFLIPLLLKIIGPVFGALITAISWLIRNIPTFVKIIKAIGSVLGTIGKIIAIAVIAPFYALYKAGEWVFNQVRSIITKFVDFFKTIWSAIDGPVIAVFNLVVSIIRAAFSVITAMTAVWWAGIKLVFGALYDFIVPKVKLAFKVVSDVIGAVMDEVTGKVQRAWAIIKAVWDAVYGFIVPPVVKAFDFIRDLITARLDATSSKVTSVWSAITSVIKAAVDRIIIIINGIKAMVDKVTSFFGQLKAAADKGVGPLIDFVKTIPGKILGAVGNLGNLLYDKGRSLIQSLINGIKSMFGAVGNTMSSLVSKITDWLPGSPAKVGPLSGQGYALYRGEALSEDFARGIAAEAAKAQQAVTGMVNGLTGAIPTDHSMAVNGALAVSALGFPSAGQLAGQATAEATRTLNVANINLNGVWDFTDPTAARKIVATLHGALDAYEKEYA